MYELAGGRAAAGDAFAVFKKLIGGRGVAGGGGEVRGSEGVLKKKRGEGIRIE